MRGNNEVILPLSRVLELVLLNQKRHGRSSLYISLAMIELGMTTGILLFLFGAIYYGRATREALHLRRSLCEVASSTINDEQCKTKFGPPICYTAVWAISYGDHYAISSEIQQAGFFYRDQALQMLNTYQLKSTYPCWYDDRNMSSVQWRKPSDKKGIILFVFGTVLVLCTSLLSCCICKSWKKQSWRETNQDNHNLLETVV